MKNPFKDHPQKIGDLTSSPIMRRYEHNPILTAKDLPYDATLVFNAGVAKFRGEYFIAPRVDLFDEKFSRPPISITTAFGRSSDGIHFTLEKEPIKVHFHGEILPWVCDARLTVLEDELYLSFCFENQHSERPGIARWRGTGTDFDAVCIGLPQQRNMILWPEKVNGYYMRLERPMVLYNEPFNIWYSKSPDLKFWGDGDLLLGVEDVPYANLKLGGGAPPIKTDRGWLLIFHAVDSDPDRATDTLGVKGWCRRYTCGAALFDLADPTKLIAITKQPLLVAETDYELDPAQSFVSNTIFPCGAVIMEDGKTLRIYYGSGDYSTNLAETTLDELWSVMTPASRLAERATVPFRLEEWKKYKEHANE